MLSTFVLWKSFIEVTHLIFCNVLSLLFASHSHRCINKRNTKHSEYRIPWSTSRFEKLIVVQLGKNFSTFCGKQSVIAIGLFTKEHQCTLSGATWTQPTHAHMQYLFTINFDSIRLLRHRVTTELFFRVFQLNFYSHFHLPNACYMIRQSDLDFISTNVCFFKWIVH
jgi:hypothetical protein